jgi:hypothetical protein
MTITIDLVMLLSRGFYLVFGGVEIRTSTPTFVIPDGGADPESMPEADAAGCPVQIKHIDSRSSSESNFAPELVHDRKRHGFRISAALVRNDEILGNWSIYICASS